MNQNKCIIKKVGGGDNFPGVPGPLLSPPGLKRLLKTAKILQTSMWSFQRQQRAFTHNKDARKKRFKSVFYRPPLLPIFWNLNPSDSGIFDSPNLLRMLILTHITELSFSPNSSRIFLMEASLLFSVYMASSYISLH